MVAETIGRCIITRHQFLVLSSMFPLYSSICKVYIRYNNNVGTDMYVITLSYISTHLVAVRNEV